MRKKIALLLIIILILSSISVVYATGPFEDIGKSVGEAIDNTVTSVTKTIGNTIEELIKYTVDKFKDIKPDSWFAETVSRLVGKGGIDGYPDGTFKPNKTITRAEFTKILVSTLGHENLSKTGSHWASGYISKAEEIGLIDKGEFKKIDKAISRNEMAKMCANALDYRGEDHIADRDKYRYQIKDFNKIPDKFRDYVLKSYAKGIINGYTDRTFGGDRGLTRAEASTVIIRVIDKNKRAVVEEKPEEISKDFIEPEFKIWYSTKNKDQYNYFLFRVTNYEDYEGKGYTFKTECISHPQLNKWKRWNPIVQKVMEVDNILIFTQKNDDIIKEMGRIYELEDIRDVEGVTLKEGEKLKYKVTVTNGETTKTYTLDAEFRDKKFRY